MSYQSDFAYLAKARSVIDSAYGDIKEGKRTTLVMSLEKDLGSGKVYAALESLERDYTHSKWMRGRVRTTKCRVKRFERVYFERLMQLPEPIAKPE